MKIVKNSGDIVDFNREKLKRSLMRSGASAHEIQGILETIQSQLYDGIRTREIYTTARKMLRKISASHAARYNLRSAIQQLGPAGFFFEKFISLLFRHEGYDTVTNLTLQGKCVSHEIDVMLRLDGVVTMVECKFHGSSAAVSDVKVPMYILSRFNDLKPARHQVFSKSDVVAHCTIVTNNRFSADAITFAGCSGLDLLGWDFPANSLKVKIDRGALYPLTCLTTLSMVEKERLLFLDIILVKQLIDTSDALGKIGISEVRRKRILNEAAGLCNYFDT